LKRFLKLFYADFSGFCKVLFKNSVILLHMKQFYDSVSLPLLAGELIKRGFPIHLFVLGFMAHAAPRVLQVGKCLGPPITDCGNSMLAGCQLSVSMARGLLWELVAELSKVDPEYPCHEHVDDLSHVLVVETEFELKAKLLKSGRLVGKEVERLKLKLSLNK
jgi:hypothetical protein